MVAMQIDVSKLDVLSLALLATFIALGRLCSGAILFSTLIRAFLGLQSSILPANIIKHI